MEAVVVINLCVFFYVISCLLIKTIDWWLLHMHEASVMVMHASFSMASHVSVNLFNLWSGDRFLTLRYVMLGRCIVADIISVVCFKNSLPLDRFSLATGHCFINTWWPHFWKKLKMSQGIWQLVGTCQETDQKVPEVWEKSCRRKLFTASFMFGVKPVFSSIMLACSLYCWIWQLG